MTQLTQLTQLAQLRQLRFWDFGTFGLLESAGMIVMIPSQNERISRRKEETTKPCPNTILSRNGNDYFRVTHSPTAPQRFD